jgi:hypothetical protein
VITLTPAQKTALNAALVAYRAASNQAVTAAQNAQAKQDALKVAMDAVTAAARIPRVDGEPGSYDMIEKVRVGAKVYAIYGSFVGEVDDIVDAT